MAIHWLLLAVFFLLNNVITSSGAPADSYEDEDGAEADDNVPGFTISGEGGNSWHSGFSTWTDTTTEGGKCVNKMSIKTNGFVDIFKFPCSAGSMGTHSAAEDILIANSKTVQSNSIYGKKPNELQVVQEGKCSLRTYTTTNGKTTASSTPVTGAKCDAMKKEHLDRMKKWQQWEAETFPPCFPFCNEASPGTSVPQQKPKPKPSSSANVNYNPSPWNAIPYNVIPSSSNSGPYTPNWGNVNGNNFKPKPSSSANVNYNPSPWNAIPYNAIPSSSNSGPYTPNWGNGNGNNFSSNNFNPFSNQFLSGLYEAIRNAYNKYQRQFVESWRR